MVKTKTHKDLILWQKSIDFVNTIYSITATFPRSEIYGLTSQIRRAAVSVPSNIAEGHARHSKKELIQFLYIAPGSLAELETQILIAKNRNFIKHEDYEKIINDLTELSKMTISLIRYITDK